MSNSELKEKCKKIDSTVSELCQWINSNGNQLRENIFNHNALIKNQLVNEGDDSELVNCNDKFYCGDEGKMKSEDGSSTKQTGSMLNVILNRMEKFGNCEKLLDRDGFFGEYRKEITKKTKLRAKKS
jgi:hypothetical protein